MNKKLTFSLLIGANVVGISGLVVTTVLLVKDRVSNPVLSLDNYVLLTTNDFDRSTYYASEFVHTDDDSLLIKYGWSDQRKKESKEFWTKQFVKLTHEYGKDNTFYDKFILQEKKSGAPFFYLNSQNLYTFSFSSFANDKLGKLILKIRYHDKEYDSLSNDERETKKIYKYKYFVVDGFKKVNPNSLKKDNINKIPRDWKFEPNAALHNSFIKTKKDEEPKFKNYADFWTEYEKKEKKYEFINSFFSFRDYEREWNNYDSNFKLDKNSLTMQKIEGKDNEFYINYKVFAMVKDATINKDYGINDLLKIDEQFYKYEEIKQTKIKMNFLELNKFADKVQIISNKSDLSKLNKNKLESERKDVTEDMKSIHKLQTGKVFPSLILKFEDGYDFEGLQFKAEDFYLEYEPTYSSPIVDDDAAKAERKEGKIRFKFRLKINNKRTDLIEKYGSSYVERTILVEGFEHES